MVLITIVNGVYKPTYIGISSIFLGFSQGFPMVFPWFSHGLTGGHHLYMAAEVRITASSTLCSFRCSVKTPDMILFCLQGLARGRTDTGPWRSCGDEKTRKGGRNFLFGPARRRMPLSRIQRRPGPTENPKRNWNRWSGSLFIFDLNSIIILQ